MRVDFDFSPLREHYYRSGNNDSYPLSGELGVSSPSALNGTVFDANSAQFDAIVYSPSSSPGSDATYCVGDAVSAAVNMRPVLSSRSTSGGGCEYV